MKKDKISKDKISKDKIIVDVYAHNWGLIIPCKTGVVFEQQTGGVCCSHVYIEGVFIPLKNPIEHIMSKDRPKPRLKSKNLLEELVKANYNYKDTGKIWERIKNVMHFDFVDVDAPKGLDYSDEGIRWIKLTKFESGWGHGDWTKNMIGKTVALIYPNCD